MDLRLMPKTNLVLGRMHIDIDFSKRDSKKQHDRRILAFHEQGFVSENNRMGQHFVANVAPVYEGIEITRVGERSRCDAEVSVQGQLPSAPGERNQTTRGLAAENLMQPVLRFNNRDVLGDIASVVPQPEMDCGIRKGHSVENLANVTQLGGRRLQELSARRRIEKKI